MTQHIKARIAAISAVTMAVSTFPQVVFGVLAVYIIGAFDVDRWQVGGLVTATGIAGALSAMPLGRLTDRIGPVSSTRIVMIMSLISFGLIAVAPTYGLLVAAALISGAPQGWCNSATNTLISDGIPSGERGIVTGVKQSGVQLGTFLGGLLLPLLAATWDWRVAVAAFLVVPLAGFIGTFGAGVRRHIPADSSGQPRGLPPIIRLVSLYGVLAGIGTSAMLTFLPLFAAENQGWSELHAGWLLAGVGLVGIGARIYWGAVAESRLGYGRALAILAGLTVCSSLILALASTDLLPSWTLILAAVLLGVGGVSWNSVGMLAVMEMSPRTLVGRGTGVVLFGFLLGYGLGAPMLGYTVDVWGSYLPGWTAVLAAFLLALAVAARVSRQEQRSKPSPVVA